MFQNPKSAKQIDVEYIHYSVAVEVGASVDFSSSNVALNPKVFPGVNDDFSSSAVSVVLILLSFRFRFSCGMDNQTNKLGWLSSFK